MKRRTFLGTLGMSASLALTGPLISTAATKTPQSPNILWIISDDHSRNDLACFGHPLVKTPNIDRLACEGMRFTNAFAVAPTCAPTRSGLITGMYPISIGAHNQRNDEAILPEHVRLLPEYFSKAGYFCVNTTWDMKRPGKTDYQFQFKPEAVYERATDWAQRKPGQPFFAQVQISEPHRPFKTDMESPIDPSRINLPPQYPDDPIVRIDFAQYLESIQLLDRKVGRVLNKLDQEGDSDDTIVFFFSDQGRPFPRGKQFLYDEGLAIPLIIRWPGKLQPGSACADLVSMVDFAPACLNLAGLNVPGHIHGRAFLAKAVSKREYIFASRDRVDDAVDRIRCLRTKRYKYIRNYYPELPYDQDETYMVMMHPTLAALKKYNAAGKLTPAQSKWMARHRPKDELYDVQNDPHELHNLADNPQYRKLLQSFQEKLDHWIRETDDRGRKPEDEDFIAKVRKDFQLRLFKTLRQRGLTSPTELYDYWRRTLKRTPRKEKTNRLYKRR
jgi:N-sulfoglucosamine sulfohydrolase